MLTHQARYTNNPCNNPRLFSPPIKILRLISSWRILARLSCVSTSLWQPTTMTAMKSTGFSWSRAAGVVSGDITTKGNSGAISRRKRSSISKALTESCGIVRRNNDKADESEAEPPRLLGRYNGEFSARAGVDDDEDERKLATESTFDSRRSMSLFSIRVQLKRMDSINGDTHSLL